MHAQFAVLATWEELVTAWQPPGDDKLHAQVAALVESHPTLTDEGYLAYLRNYGGALVVRRDAFVLSLYGFSHDIGMHLVDGPGEPVFEDCFVFCDLVVPGQVRARVDDTQVVDTVAVGFGFAAASSKQPGVYRSVAGGPMAWYCATFLDWLDRVIESDGQVDR